jgi:hypothetical protein
MRKWLRSKNSQGQSYIYVRIVGNKTSPPQHAFQGGKLKLVKVMKGVYVTQLLKTLALTVVILTGVTAPSLAKVGGLFDSGVIEDFKPTKHFSATELFSLEPLRKVDDSFSSTKIAKSEVVINNSDDSDTNIIAPAPVLAKAEPSIESVIFNSTDLALWTKEAARVNAPSYRQVLGDYFYSAFNWADYIARHRATAFLVTYARMDLLEEGIANVAYYAATGLSLVTGGAGFFPGYAAYYGIKGGIRAARYAVPFFEIWLAYHYTDSVQSSIHYGLDTAQVAAKETVSIVRSFASYLWPSWA